MKNTRLPPRRWYDTEVENRDAEMLGATLRRMDETCMYRNKSALKCWSKGGRRKETICARPFTPPRLF
jgi:hypothetical protein